MHVRWSVREAKAEDIPDVRRLFQEYQDKIGISLCFQGFQEELDGLPGAYARPHGNLFLAFMDGTAVGCVGVRAINAKECELKRLYVQEHAQGMGIGECLTRRALREGRKLGYKVLRLDTLNTMTPAIRLYERMGFVRTAAYYENPIEGAVYLEKRLA